MVMTAIPAGLRQFRHELMRGRQLPGVGSEVLVQHLLSSSDIRISTLLQGEDMRIQTVVLDAVLRHGTTAQRQWILREASLTCDQIDLALNTETEQEALHGLSGQPNLRDDQALKLIPELNGEGLRPLLTKPGLSWCVRREARSGLLHKFDTVVDCVGSRADLDGYFTDVLEVLRQAETGDRAAVDNLNVSAIVELWHAACMASLPVSDDDTVMLSKRTGTFRYGGGELSRDLEYRIISAVPPSVEEPITFGFRDKQLDPWVRALCYGEPDGLLRKPEALASSFRKRPVRGSRVSTQHHRARAIGRNPGFLDVLQSLPADSSGLSAWVDAGVYCLGAEVVLPLLPNGTVLPDYTSDLIEGEALLSLSMAQALEDHQKAEQLRLVAERLGDNRGAWNYYLTHADEWDGSIGDFAALCLALND